MPLRVLIFNRVSLYAEGLRRLLEEDDRLLVVGLAHDEREYRASEKLAPDLVVTDGHGFRHAAGRNKKILLILDCQHGSLPFGDLREMVEKGLVGIIDAGTDPPLFRKAVRKVLKGELWIDHQIIRSSLCAARGADHDIKLSKRESEILGLICNGDSNKQIADKLCISEHTVKTHCNHLYKKFQVTCRLQLAVHAMRMSEFEKAPPSS